MTDGTDDQPKAETTPTPAIHRRDESGEESDESVAEDNSGNIAGTLDLDKPLEPQEIDLENAIFVALGALLVIGFFVTAIQGL